MGRSLSNLVDNLAEGIHKIKWNKRLRSIFEYGSIKESLMKYKFLSCYKEYLTKIDNELKKRLNNTFKFSNNDINKFILLLIKDVYPYEYTDE